MTDAEKDLQAQRLKRALEGTDSGSDTRAGSLRGGSASGSDDDPDSEEVNRNLAELGRKLANENNGNTTAEESTDGEDAKTQPTDDVS